MADADLVKASMEQPVCFPVALRVSFETSGARVKALRGRRVLGVDLD
jgi:hypothetical protein